MDKRILIAMILVLSLVGTASAATWSVDGSGGADFIGIQDAINDASVGDTILVHSGVYYENVVVDKSVTLKGVGQPVVDANSSGSAITLTEDRITLVGFNVTNSGRWAQSDAGINVNTSNNNITGNNVYSNNLKGILLYCSGNNHLYLNNLINNTDNADWLWYRQGYESANIWNSTEKITYSYDGSTYESYLGNYWDDYEGTDADADADSDGIGDTRYSTNSSFID